MGMRQKVDVICQNSVDGTLIPIKVRMIDEDGITQQFVIKSYKEVAAFTDGYTMPNEVKISPNCMQKKFECKVQVMDRMQSFFLIFNKNDLTWMLMT